jgi:hypothetical protein
MQALTPYIPYYPDFVYVYRSFAGRRSDAMIGNLCDDLFHD